MSRSPYSLLSSISERLFSLFISDCHTTTATVSIKGKGSRALPPAADPSLSLLLSTCLYRRGPPDISEQGTWKSERITNLKRRTLFPDLVGKRPFSKEVRASRNAAIEFALLVGKKRIPPRSSALQVITTMSRGNVRRHRGGGGGGGGEAMKPQGK